jgi:hypothetical protein
MKIFFKITNIFNRTIKKKMNSDNDDHSSVNGEVFTNETYKSKYSASNKNVFQQQQQQQETPFETHENPYHFQTKIHNSGFWGDNRRRRGTWLVAIGAILLSISIVMIGVFWRWWYGPQVNIPCRIVAITLLVCGLFSIIIGLISNTLMESNRESKYFLGSPPRCASWLLFIGLFFIVVAADFITFYYSYWHNRYINTPFIISSIILFFFGFLFVIVGLRRNIKLMKKQYKLVDGKEYIKK